MGGGGAMRAAAKVAGITVANSTGLRGLPSLSPAEHPFATATRKASRPVSSIVSSSDKNNYPIEAAMQRPCWELDDWEFAGGEEEMIGQPMPRLVFGGVPTIEEAREATSQLKDALDKVYLSSPYSTGSGDRYRGDHDFDLLLFPKPESLETKSRGTGQGTVMSVPKDGIKAFRLLSESRVAQSVVASIASDPKIWDAVLENEAVVEFFKSQKSNMDPVMEEFAADASLLDQQSSTNVDDYANGYYMEYFQGVKNKVVEMMSTLSDYFQELFGGSTADTNVDAIQVWRDAQYTYQTICRTQRRKECVDHHLGAAEGGVREGSVKDMVVLHNGISGSGSRKGMKIIVDGAWRKANWEGAIAWINVDTGRDKHACRINANSAFMAEALAVLYALEGARSKGQSC